MDFGFKYVIENHGIDTEESYPYTAKNGVCRFREADIGATISSYKDVLPRKSESSLQEAVATVSTSSLPPSPVLPPSLPPLFCPLLILCITKSPVPDLFLSLDVAPCFHLPACVLK